MSTGPAPQLVVETGRLRGASFDIPPGRSEIGRQAGVAILLDDQDVSRRHAVIDRSGGRVVLADLGSTNGTWLNRRRLRAGDLRDGGELRDGDEVRVGSVTLRFSAAGGETAVRHYDFGDVHGPVQTGGRRPAPPVVHRRPQGGRCPGRGRGQGGRVHRPDRPLARPGGRRSPDTAVGA
jgi:FHA domain